MQKQIKIGVVREVDCEDILQFWDLKKPEISDYDSTVPLSVFSNSTDINQYIQDQQSSKIHSEDQDTAQSLSSKQEKDIQQQNTAQKQLMQESQINHEQKDNLEPSPVTKVDSDVHQQLKQRKTLKKLKKKNGKKYKGDEIKNMWGSTFKITVKAFISEKYRRQADLICQKCQTSFYQVSKYFKSKLNESISLYILGQYLDDQEGAQEGQRRIKKAFNCFYVWFMRNKYALHVVQSQDIQHQQVYLSGKNKLVYLPQLHKNSKTTKIKKYQKH